MLVLSDLPGVRGLAAEVLDKLYGGSLVAVSVPVGPIGERWLHRFLKAFRNQAREHRQPLPVEVGSLEGAHPNPLVALAATGGPMAGVNNLDDLLKCDQNDRVLVVVVECNDVLGPEWKEFFKDVARAYKGAGTLQLRPLLAIIAGSREYPPIEQDVTSRVFALWNVVQWEELRLLAAAALPQHEHALMRAWRVASYTGAANWDPEVLEDICRKKPDQLDDIISLSIDGAVEHHEPGWNPTTVPEQRWQVPNTCIESWASGGMLGYTVDRGAARALRTMGREAAKSYLRAAIWREQLAGIFPVIIELGFRVTSVIDSNMGTDWHQDVDKEQIVPGEYLHLEPREVMDIFKTGRYNRLPKSIWSLLKSLRKTRNELAHMSPVDLRRIRKILGEYAGVQERLGNG